jgi:hypothetical protein
VKVQGNERLAKVGCYLLTCLLVALALYHREIAAWGQLWLP